MPLDSVTSLDSYTSVLAWRSASLTLLLAVFASRSGGKFSNGITAGLVLVRHVGFELVDGDFEIVRDVESSDEPEGLALRQLTIRRLLTMTSIRWNED